MSIAVLNQVYDEMRRLAIAGSVVAGGDFRLKKLIAPLEQAGAKAPVFAKVGQAVKTLVESNEQTSSDALLELATLVNAILYTQGETGAAGPIEPIQTTNLGPQTTQASARLLKPLLEALTETGSGRLEVIKDSFEREAFRDLRLVRPALGALDDPYPDIAEFVADKVLPLYGQAILPELKAKFDLKGKAGHLRRLKLLHRLDPAGTRDTVKQALEGGSKEMKIVAIECLGDSPEDLAFLLEQAKAKSKEVRGAAFKALSRIEADEGIEVLQKAMLGDDLQLAVAAICVPEPPRAVEPVDGKVVARRRLTAIRSQKLLAVVIAICQDQLAQLLKAKDKKAAGEHASRLISLLGSLENRDDRQTEKFLLDLFQRRDEISVVKGEPGGQDVVGRIVGLLESGSTNVQNGLIDAHASLTPNLLGTAFHAALGTRSPAEVYELFAPYLLAKVDEKKKARDAAWAKREAIIEIVHAAFTWGNLFRAMEMDLDSVVQSDPRWLDAAVKLRNIDLVRAFIRPGHTEANRLLSEGFAVVLKKSTRDIDCIDFLESMIRAEHPDVVDAVIAVLKKLGKAKNSWGLSSIGQLIPKLPKSAATRLEELLPSLDDKAADGLLEYITVLKNK